MRRRNAELQIAHHIAPAAQGWRQLANAALAEFRVSNSSGWCLVYLDRLGPDARQIDLARAIGISHPSLVRTLDQLEAAGFVERSPCPDDRRSNRLIVTSRGKELAGQIEGKLASLRAQLLAGITDADLEATIQTLEILSERIAERRS